MNALKTDEATFEAQVEEYFRKTPILLRLSFV